MFRDVPECSMFPVLSTPYLKGKGLTSGWRASLKIKKRFCFKSYFRLQKKPGPDPLKSGPDQFFLTVYTGNKQVRLMIEKCIVHKRETTVKHGRLTWRRWYGTTMRLHSAFEQRKGSGLVFFFRFGAIPAYDPFHENMVRKVYTEKISGRTNFSMGPDPFFFL